MNMLLCISLSLLSLCSDCMAYSNHGFIKPSSSHHHQQHNHNHVLQHNRRGSVYHPFTGSTFMSLLSQSSSSLSSPESSTLTSSSSSSVHLIPDEVSDKHRIVSHNGVHTLSFNVAGKEFQFETGTVNYRYSHVYLLACTAKSYKATARRYMDYYLLAIFIDNMIVNYLLACLLCIFYHYYYYYYYYCIIVSTGKIGRQAGGSVVARIADTMVYTTICSERDSTPVDFTPLRVDYFARYR